MPSAFVVAAQLRAQGQAGYTNLTRAVKKTAQLGLAKVKANASGRPGPRRVTGDYKRSMNVETLGPFAASIGTDKIQARRLENGFVGEDSLGRHYNQPAYPHWEPMRQWIEPVLEEAVLRVIDTEPS